MIKRIGLNQQLASYRFDSLTPTGGRRNVSGNEVVMFGFRIKLLHLS